MQNTILKVKLSTRLQVVLAVSLLSLAAPSLSAWNNQGSMPWSSGFSPWNMGGMPGGSGFSPWSMGGMPGGSGFSPWSMGGMPGGSGFSPWNMGGMPGGSGFSPWGGNGWNSSVWPWSGSGLGNSWGNNTWMPWSNNSSFLGRRNNDDWITRMFLINALNQQAPINSGLMPNYPAQGFIGSQSLPAQQPQTLFYPQAQSLNQPSNTPTAVREQDIQPSAVGFPAASSSFSPFIESSPSNRPATNPPMMPTPSSLNADSKPQAKTWVFPDGSRY